MANRRSILYKAGKRGGTRRNLENEQVEVLYFNYKLKKPGADIALIKGMWTYIKPIYQTIVYGVVFKASNRIWVQFLEHYMSHDFQGTWSLQMRKSSSEYNSYIENTITYIRRLFKGIPKEELKHIMSIAIWELANSYSHYGTPNFLLYFSRYYTHRLQSYIKPLIKDYLYYETMMGHREPLTDAVLANEALELPESYNDWYKTLYTGNSQDELGVDWVIGYTADLFESLSRYDRQLLKWRYVDNIKLAAISERLGVSYRTVQRYYADIIKRLEVTLSDRRLITTGSDKNGSISAGNRTDSFAVGTKDDTVS